MAEEAVRLDHSGSMHTLSAAASPHTHFPPSVSVHLAAVTLQHSTVGQSGTGGPIGSCVANVRASVDFLPKLICNRLDDTIYSGCNGSKNSRFCSSLGFESQMTFFVKKELEHLNLKMNPMIKCQIKRQYEAWWHNILLNKIAFGIKKHPQSSFYDYIDLALHIICGYWDIVPLQFPLCYCSYQYLRQMCARMGMSVALKQQNNSLTI